MTIRANHIDLLIFSDDFQFLAHSEIGRLQNLRNIQKFSGRNHLSLCQLKFRFKISAILLAAGPNYLVLVLSRCLILGRKIHCLTLKFHNMLRLWDYLWKESDYQCLFSRSISWSTWFNLHNIWLLLFLSGSVFRKFAANSTELMTIKSRLYVAKSLFLPSLKLRISARVSYKISNLFILNSTNSSGFLCYKNEPINAEIRARMFA